MVEQNLNYGNGSVIDLNMYPARIISQQAVDPARNIAGASPNFGRYNVPHMYTVQAKVGTISRVYRPSDEAMRHSLENARFMRNECGIMECVEGRQRGTALLNWHLVPDDEGSMEQKFLVEELTAILERIPNFLEYRRNLLEALWYGKYANAHQWGRQFIKGKSRTMITGWQPRHGDKLVFRYDDGTYDYIPGQLGIRVGAGYTIETAKDFLGNQRRKVEPTDQGLAYFFDEWEREYMVAVHKHIIEDGAYDDPLGAGSIHGVGIRSRIYWTWYAMTECLSFLLEYIERSALGVEIWRFPGSNPEAESKVRKAAEERIGGGRSVVLMPVFPGEDSDQFEVQHIEPGMAGADAVSGLITDFFMHKIKRYILGQILTTETDSTGLGSGVADAHMSTFMDIIRYDARKLEETITGELVGPIKKWNFPKANNIHVRFVIDTEAPEVEEKLGAYKNAWDMGLSIKADDVRGLIGASEPGPDDEVLENQQGGMPGMEGGGGMFPGIGPGGGDDMPPEMGGPGEDGPDDDGGGGNGEPGADPAIPYSRTRHIEGTGGGEDTFSELVEDGDPEDYDAQNRDDDGRFAAEWRHPKQDMTTVEREQHNDRKTSRGYDPARARNPLRDDDANEKTTTTEREQHGGHKKALAARKEKERKNRYDANEEGGSSSDWVSYTGKRGGTGWKNSKTGQIVYGDRKPGESSADARKRALQKRVDDFHSEWKRKEEAKRTYKPSEEEKELKRMATRMKTVPKGKGKKQHKSLEGQRMMFRMERFRRACADHFSASDWLEVDRYARQMGFWEEADHPRDEGGKFTEGGNFETTGGGKQKQLWTGLDGLPGQRDFLDEGMTGILDTKDNPVEETPEQRIERASKEWKDKGTKSEGFKSWFGDWEKDPANSSKVVDDEGNPKETHSLVSDDEGNPIVVHHGTGTGGFNEFEKRWATGAEHKGNPEDLLYGPGFYFTEDSDIARQYSEINKNKVKFSGDKEGLAKEIREHIEFLEAQKKMGADVADQDVDRHLHRFGQAVERLESGEEQDWLDDDDSPARAWVKMWLPSHVVEEFWKQEEKTPEVKEVYLNIRKPLSIDGAIAESDLRAIADKIESVKLDVTPTMSANQAKAGLAFIKRQLSGLASQLEHGGARSIRGHEVYRELSGNLGRSAGYEVLRQLGYDGITHVGGNIMGGGHEHRVWIAFEPNQIKSTDNRGTFDPAENRMDYAAWDESKHPRADDGKFGSGAGSVNDKDKAQRDDVSSGTSPMRLWRAAEDDYISSDSVSFSEDRDSAESYLDNPGFGGHKLFQTDIVVDEDDLLDLTGHDAMDRLLETLDSDHDYGAIGVDELVPRVADRLLEAGYQWVKVDESYPENTVTWIYIGGSLGDEPELEEFDRYSLANQKEKAWKESQHPRGEGGEFTSKGQQGKRGVPKDTARTKLTGWQKRPVYLSGSVGKAQDELAKKHENDYAFLVQPDTKSNLNHADKYPFFGVDNGGFGGNFNEKKFRSLLDDIGKKRLTASVLFVAAPDVFDPDKQRGDPLATIEKSKPWFKEIRDRGMPPALVAQDGIEQHMDEIPWDDFDVVFMGGGDDWKEGYFDGPVSDQGLLGFADEVRQEWDDFIDEVHRRGKRIHVGRVNSPERLAFAFTIGADSVDGNYNTFAPNINSPKIGEWLDQMEKAEHDDKLAKIEEIGGKPAAEMSMSEWTAASRAATKEMYRRFSRNKVERYWKEAQHPRGGDGRFVAGSGGSGTAADDPKAIRRELEQDSLGIPRHDMPQILGEHTSDFLEELERAGVGSRKRSIKAGELKGTQSELNIDKVMGMAGKMRESGPFAAAPPLASNDGYILDGHHRWAAQRVVDPSETFDVVEVDLPIEQLLDEAWAYDKVEFAGVQHSEPVKPPKPKASDPGKIKLENEETAQVAMKFLGVEESDLGSLVGAPDGTTLEVFAEGSRADPQGLEITVTGKGVIAMRRIYRDSDGGLHMKNVVMEVDSEARGQGIGTKMFAKQVEFANSLGVESISCEAAGQKGGSFIGYKVWPLMGYDGPFDPSDYDPEEIPAELTKARTIQQVYRTKKGREWWAEYGHSIDVRFDVREGSESRKILDRYMRRKRAADKIPEEYRARRT